MEIESQQDKRQFRQGPKGFTLLEILIVIAILAILTTVGIGYYRNVVKSNEVELAAKSIANDLKVVKAKAIAGEGNLRWGIHFVIDSNGDYYEIFSTPTDYNDPAKVVIQTVYLPKGVNLTGTPTDIIFDRVTGNPLAAAEVVLNSENYTASVEVSAQGNLKVNKGPRAKDLPGAPTGLNAVAGLGQVNLTWTAPSQQGQTAINNYRIYRGLTAGSEIFVANTGNTTTAYTDINLNGGQIYYYKVSAENTLGEGPKSLEASATPTSSIPSAPTNLVATPGNSQVSLSWTAAIPNGSPLTQYKVYRGTSPGNETYLASVGSGDISANTIDTSTVSVATEGSAQRKTFWDSVNNVYWAFYYNGSQLEYSNSTNGTTWVSRGTLASSSNFSIYYSPSTTDVALINVEGAALKTRDGTLGPTSITWLAPSTVDTFNLITDSPVNITRNEESGLYWITYADRDAAFDKILYANISEDNSTSSFANPIELSRHANQSDFNFVNSVPVVLNEYVYFIWQDLNVDVYGLYGRRWTGALGTTYTISSLSSFRGFSVTSVGLSAHLLYTVGQLKYRNYVADTDTWSSAVTLDSNSVNTTPAISLDKTHASNLYAFWTRSNTIYTKRGINPYASANWDSSAAALVTSGTNNGLSSAFEESGGNYMPLIWTQGSGSPYSVKFMGRALSQNGTPATMYVDTAVSNGTTYYYKVSAVNGLGEGAQSSEVSAIPALVPGTPTGLSGTPANQQVVLNWSAPASDGGSAIINYKIYQGTTSGQETLLTTVGNVLTYTNTSLTNGTTYYYKVSAVNPVGEGPQSSEASATPNPTAPGAPTGLNATGGLSKVDLSWTAPTNDGGSAITNYKVYRSTTSGAETLLTTIGNVTIYTDSAVTAGTTYYYKVSAVNTLGTGTQSTEASGVPTGGTPDAPTGLSATGGNAQVTLNWSAPASDGGSAITNYNIYRSLSTGTETLYTTLGNVLTYLDNTIAFGSNGVVQSDPTSGIEEANAIVTDSSNLYIAGYQSTGAGCVTGGQCWRIEKRDKTTGALVTAFDGDGIVQSDPTSANEYANAITADSSYLYIAGLQDTGAGCATGGLCWRIEKRDITTGALVTAFDGDGIVQSDPTNSSDAAQAIAVDSSYLYIAGYQSAGTGCTGGGGSCWRIEKRNITTGALVTAFDGDGFVQSDPSNGSDIVYAMTADSSYLYIAGNQGAGCTSGGNCWRIEKRDITTGALVNAFDSDGAVQSDPTATSDVARTITADSSYLYIAGFQSAGGWRIEKRDKTTGALVTAFDGDGIAQSSDATNGTAYAITADSSYLYITGDQSPLGCTSSCWRMEKRDKTTGALVTAFDGDGIAASDPTNSSDIARTITADSSYLYIAGTQASGGACTSFCSRIEKRIITSGALTAGVSNGTTYYYKVSAVNAIAEGPQSNEASATPNVSFTIGATAGSQVSTLNSGDTMQSANALGCNAASSCAAFTLAPPIAGTLTSIKLTQTGTVSMDDLSNFVLYYDTDGNFSNGTTGQFSTTTSLSSTAVTINGSLAISSGNTYYFYLSYDLRSPLLSTAQTYPKGGQAIDFQIASNSDVVASGMAGSGAPVSLAGSTTVLPEADEVLASMGSEGRIVDNLSTAADRFLGVDQDGDYIYSVGYDTTVSADPALHIQKRYKATGALVTAFDGDGRVTDNISNFADVLQAVVVDSQYIYAAGYDHSPGGTAIAFHIQKRDKTTGALVSAFGTGGRISDNYSSLDDVFFGITQDAQYIYLAGYDNSNSGFHIQKRDKTTGALVSGFGTSGRISENYTIGNDGLEGLVVDANYIYVAGTDGNGTGGAMHIQKRDKVTGNLCDGTANNCSGVLFGTNGHISDDVSTGDDSFFGLTADSQYLYPVGRENGAIFHIQKRRMSDGALCTAANCGTAFDTDGRVSDNYSAGDDTFFASAVDSQSVYAAGYSNAEEAVHVQKRDKLTGVLDTNFGIGGRINEDLSTSAGTSGGLDSIDKIVIDSQYIYAVGRNNGGGTVDEFIIQKRRLDTGSTAAAFGNSSYFGDSITVSGFGFGTPSAGANRADCTTATVDRGCVKYTVGGTVTVPYANISAWSNTAVTFSTTGLGTTGGPGALEMRAANQADASKLGSSLSTQTATTRSVLYLQTDDTEVGAFDTMTLGYPTEAGSNSQGGATVTFANPPCESTGVNRQVFQPAPAVDGITGDICLATFFSQPLGQTNSVTTSQTNSITVQVGAGGLYGVGNNAVAAPRVRLYKYDGLTYTLFATLTGTAWGIWPSPQSFTGTPSANVSFNPSDRIVALFTANITSPESSGGTDQIVLDIHDPTDPNQNYISLQNIGFSTPNRPDLTGSRDDDFTTYAAETACSNAGVTYNTKWTCTTPTGTSLGKFKAHYGGSPAVTDVGSWLAIRNLQASTLGTNFGTSPTNTYLYQVVDTNSDGDGNISTVVNHSLFRNTTGSSPFLHSGLLLWSSNTDYAEVQVNWDATALKHVVQLNQNGTLSNAASLNLSHNLVWLRWSKSGTTYTPQYSMDGANWISLGSGITHATTFTRAGLTTYAGVASGDTGAAFDYFDYNLIDNTAKTMTIATAGSQVANLNSGASIQSADDPACTSTCAAFTISVTPVQEIITSIKLTDIGTASLSNDLSNFALYYDTDGNFNNGVTGQFGNGVGTATAETVTFIGALTISPSTTYYFYPVFDLKSQLSSTRTYPQGGQTVNFRIASNSDITVNGIATTITGAPATIAGATTIRPDADAILGITAGNDGRIVDNYTGADEGYFAMTSDSQYLYGVGYDMNAGNYAFHIQKRLKSTGALCDAATCGTAFGTAGRVSDNYSTGSDLMRGIAIDDQYMYLVGEDSSPGATTAMHIQKRLKSTGALCDAATCGTAFGTSGRISDNYTSGQDKLYKVVVDTQYLYVAGWSAGNGAVFHVQKRDKVTGALVTSFGSGGRVIDDFTANNDEFHTIAMDEKYIYLAGGDGTPGSGKAAFHIQKRLKTTGALESSFGSAGRITDAVSNNNDQFEAIVVDSDYIYAAGKDQSAGTTNDAFHIQKRNKITGALCDGVGNCADGAFDGDGRVVDNYSASLDAINGMAVDSGYIYIAGVDSSVSSTDASFHLQKRLKTTGTLDTGFGTAGRISENYVVGSGCNDSFYGITLDSSYLYTAGFDGTPCSTNGIIHVQKRKLSNGSLTNTFGTTIAAGSTATIGGYGFGAPTAGADRQDCVTATVDKGCVKFTLGPTYTVLNTSITSWVNTAISFVANAGAATSSGTASVEVRAANQADPTKLDLTIP